MTPLEAISASLLGTVLGLFTGLVPGLHINTVSFLIFLLPFGGNLFFAVTIASMSISHSFMDFVPSILLGAPDNENFLSMLHSHRLLMSGRGIYAVRLALLGCLLGLVFGIILSPFFAYLLIRNYAAIRTAVPFLLLLSLFLMLFSESCWKKFLWSLAVIILSGTLGILSLGTFPGAIFPLAAGFFGGATLIYSLMKKSSLSPQTENNQPYPKGVFSASLSGAAAGSLVSTIPSFTAATSSFLVGSFSGKMNSDSYLVSLGSVNVSSMLFSFVALYAVGIARTGSAVALKSIIPMNTESILLLLAACLLSGSLAFLAAEFVSGKFVSWLAMVDYSLVNTAVLLFIIILVAILTGLVGVMIFLSASFIGLAANCAGTKRSCCMAFLVMPTLMLYLGIAG